MKLGEGMDEMSARVGRFAARDRAFTHGTSYPSSRYTGQGDENLKMSARILIVDDDEEQRSDLATMVRSLGYDVTTAADGRSALAALANAPVSAILTDLVMPVMDGTALLKELAARGDRTPTVVLTGFGSIDQAISYVHDLKAFWFIKKNRSNRE